ncbi:glucokinase regulatory protein [Lates japonicus]|uniref:Glucokinase regulatory protein n=1 Tax=Lates japonicus TaxID=270547 RepID=A0AAD3MZP7_LATJO|nr:glucokinase regulatory protein [Lates japonicus]
MWIAAESSGSSASTSYSWAKPPPPHPTPALPPSDCAAMFPFPLLPSCETHDNRTVVLSRGARIPRHFPDTCCPLPSRAAATAVSLSRPGREEPSEPAAARRRLPFFLVRSRHRHRALASSSSSGIRSRSSPAALHHPVLRARSSRATGGYDVMHLPLFLRRVLNRMTPDSCLSHRPRSGCRYPASAAAQVRSAPFRSSSPLQLLLPHSSLSLSHSHSALYRITTSTPYSHLPAGARMCTRSEV